MIFNVCLSLCSGMTLELLGNGEVDSISGEQKGVDFDFRRSDLPILVSGSTFDQSDVILRHRSEIYRSIRSEPLVIQHCLDETIQRLAACPRGVGPYIGWGDKQHDKLFKLAGVKRYRKLDNQPFVFRMCFSLLMQLANTEVYIELKYFADQLASHNIDLNLITVDLFNDIMKIQSQQVKHANSKTGSVAGWPWFVDWDQMSGYNVAAPLSDDEVVDKVIEWCRGEVRRPEKDTIGDFSQYGEDFVDVVSKLLQPLVFCNKEAPDYREWLLLKSTWVTSGSSRGAKVSLHDLVTNNTIASKSTKAVYAQTYDVEELYQAMMHGGIDDGCYHVAEKVEPGQKRRLIISAPLVQQLRMSYVEFVIRDSLHFMNRWSTLFMSSQRIKSFYDDMIHSCMNDYKIHLPLDASHFDWSVSKQEVYAVLDVMMTLVNKSAIVNSNRAFNMLGLIRSDWFDVDVKFHDKVICKWERGLPSGVKWTALMGTIINAARFGVCKLQCARIPEFGRLNVTSEFFQGDDMSIQLTRVVDIVRIIFWYNYMGIEVNPTKNFMSKNVDEFLRKIFRSRVMTGYPARRLVKLLFRDPLKHGPPNRLEASRETATSLWSMLWRFSDYTATVELIQYACKVNFEHSRWIGEKPNATEITRWLRTRTVLGGVGLCLKDSNFSRPVAFEIIYEDVKPNDRYSIPLSGLNLERINKMRRLFQDYPDDPEIEKKSIALALAPEPPRTLYRLKKVYPVLGRIPTNISTSSILNRKGGGWSDWRPRSLLIYLPIDDVIEKYCAESDLQQLRDVTDPLLLKQFDRIKARCHHSVLYHWIKGTLPETSIRAEVANDVVTSVYCSRVREHAFGVLLSSKKNIKYSDFVDTAVGVCVAVDNYVKTSYVRKLNPFYGS